MPHAQYVAVSLPEGRRLAALFGISEDLLACRDYILLYKSICQTERSQLNYQLMDCIITTIFIRYGRCFGSCVRSRTHQELKSIMDAADLPVHQLAIDFRDKHFAHSINRCESPALTVSLRIDSPDREVTSVSVGINSFLAPDMFVFDNLLILIDKLRAWAISEQNTECQRLLPIIKGQYSIDDLYKLLGNPPKKPMQYGDVSKARKST